jgi:hypothetical protein
VIADIKETAMQNLSNLPFIPSYLGRDCLGGSNIKDSRHGQEKM